ncbi:cyclic nucleotide-binding domain-containing protein [Agromyces protaetiae]|uniref:Cyclic nucleotide-binding domain-containing protein n=1 Tax=Agromyces protaetiae TaxID=2509455 RepID=A0A4P6FAV1_9MICO|nr:FAD-dependent oxidoreductase [Agromyces protaetiae]QAY72815.1 cyclic nucleotide-binding domain-containing protein [Agromyces protaetiae]
MGTAFATISPPLADLQWARLLRYGEPKSTVAGETLFSAGTRWYDLILIEEGEVTVVREPFKSLPEAVVISFGPRQFVGELGLLNGQKSFLSARVTAPGRVRRVSHESLQRLMSEDDELCDLLLHAFWSRREMLRNGPAKLTLKIVGSSRSPETMALRRFAERMELAHEWADSDDPESAAKAEAHGITVADLPAAIVQGEKVPRAKPGAIAELLGLAYSAEEESGFDLAVVGAGPAGLAAAIYGASEGLRTVLLDAVAPGGQSAATLRIENYLGFPFGVSGGELTSQACLQALKFGVRINSPCEAVSLVQTPAGHEITLADGAVVRARSVVVTTGVTYRSLGLDRWHEFERGGIHYAASAIELRQVVGADVVVVGGANSAGQASLALAANGCRVRLVVRAEDLGAQMSSYLVDRIVDNPRIDVHTGTRVVGLEGGDSLEAVALDGAFAGTVGCRGLFCFIGARPATEWLDAERDDDGFLRTGVEVVDSASSAWQAVGRMPLPYETSIPGVFAAGDVRRGSMKRVAAAVGEGSSAVASVHRALAALRVPA